MQLCGADVFFPPCNQTPQLTTTLPTTTTTTTASSSPYWCELQKKRADCLETRGVSLSASDRRKAVWKGLLAVVDQVLGGCPTFWWDCTVSAASFTCLPACLPTVTWCVCLHHQVGIRAGRYGLKVNSNISWYIWAEYWYTIYINSFFYFLNVFFFFK